MTYTLENQKFWMEQALKELEGIETSEENIKQGVSVEWWERNKETRMQRYANCLTHLAQSMEEARPEAWTNLGSITDSNLVAA